MLYRFKSKASGDVVMVETHGNRVLEAMGREPSPRGIVTVEQLPGVIAALRVAIEADEAIRATIQETGGRPDDDRTRDEEAPPAGVGLRQRAWPMLDLLQRSLDQGADVVWGV